MRCCVPATAPPSGAATPMATIWSTNRAGRQRCSRSAIPIHKTAAFIRTSTWSPSRACRGTATGMGHPIRSSDSRGSASLERRRRMSDPRVAYLAELQKKILWLSSWMIHNANHLRENTDGLKVGGHQASCASLATIMTTLYLAVLRPQDRVAVKPHASPAYHAIQYLLGNQTREKLEAFRGYKGAQSYPSRTKDVDDVDFSTGSVGLGVAQTLFSSLVQDYIGAKGWAPPGAPAAKMVALIGDAELDEGNIYEALVEGWKQGLRNVWWVIDYNRQSLDAIVHEDLWQRVESVFRNFGWDVVVLKYGALQEAAFLEPGGMALKEWIDRCP